MSKNHKNVFLNYIEHFLILVSAVSGYISVSSFDFLCIIPIGITSSAIELKIVQ